VVSSGEITQICLFSSIGIQSLKLDFFLCIDSYSFGANPEIASVFPFLISSVASFTIGGVQLHHWTPNFILHISIFVHLCEAFLGIEPHFDLFQYFFYLKLHPNNSKVDVVGGAGLQFRQGKKPKYIPYELSDKVID